MSTQASLLQAQLQNYIDEHDLSSTSVARAINYSGSVISQWLAGKYTGDTAKVDDAVKAFLQRQHEKKAAPKESIPFIFTSTAKKAHEVARMSHLDGEIGVICSDAGYGKSRAMVEYAKKNRGVIYIEADLSYNAKVLFSTLHKRIGKNGQGTLHEMKEDIIMELADTGRMIIIDQAEYLPHRALDLIRTIYDRAHIGIVLVGLKNLVANLQGRHGQFAYLSSRVDNRVELAPLTPKDSQEIVHRMLPDANGAWQEFHRYGDGNVRVLEKLIRRSKRIAALNNTKVTAEVVRKAGETLLIRREAKNIAEVKGGE